jgi:hypothetical protein
VYFVQVGCLWDAYRDRELSVFVRFFRAPLQWDKDDPNDLDLRLPGTGSAIPTLSGVTRRSEEEGAGAALETENVRVLSADHYQLTDKPRSRPASAS